MVNTDREVTTGHLGRVQAITYMAVTSFTLKRTMSAFHFVDESAQMAGAPRTDPVPERQNAQITFSEHTPRFMAEAAVRARKLPSCFELTRNLMQALQTVVQQVQNGEFDELLGVQDLGMLMAGAWFKLTGRTESTYLRLPQQGKHPEKTVDECALATETQ